jgi:peptidyl-prolyl cis-trans isomerase SurA
MTPISRFFLRAVPLLLFCLVWAGGGLGVAHAQGAKATPSTRAVDYIVAVINNDLVTQVEVAQRITRAREEAARNGTRLPGDAELRRQIVELLIDERVQVVGARDSGMKVEEPEIDRAIDNIASMNKLTLPELRERLRADGTDYTRFRANLRDQILAERMREREVQSRIKISDIEIEAYIAEQRAARLGSVDINIAQILVSVPEGADEATVSQRRARIETAQARLKAGESFAAVARALSEDGNREKGGEIGPKAPDKLPDLFVDAVRTLAVGQVTPQPIRSGAGFHLLKLVARDAPDFGVVVQTRARHILLRPSARLSPEAAQRRLVEFRGQILAGQRGFEELAREVSEDGTAPRGGDLGWASPGNFVPEFESAMNALPLGGISSPVVSRFGIHLIQVVERRSVPVDPKQVREQAKAALRERKFEGAYAEWLDELRSRTFIEMREPPL